jgi:hypothetical protein
MHIGGSQTWAPFFITSTRSTRIYARFDGEMDGGNEWICKI